MIQVSLCVAGSPIAVHLSRFTHDGPPITAREGREDPS